MAEIFDNEYSPNTPVYDPETQPLDEVINQAIDTALKELHTWLPCTVSNVRNNGFVDVQPLIQRKYTDGTVVNLPTIQQVPVIQPRGGSYSVKLPVAVGDSGIALFCERSLDNWIVAGGFVDPQDPRMHDISDAVFIPGLYPTSSIPAGAPTDMVFQNGKAVFTLQQSGRFKLQNQANELLSALDELVQDLIDALIITGIGPQPFDPSTIAAFTAVKVKIDSLKGT